RDRFVPWLDSDHREAIWRRQFPPGGRIFASAARLSDELMGFSGGNALGTHPRGQLERGQLRGPAVIRRSRHPEESAASVPGFSNARFHTVTKTIGTDLAHARHGTHNGGDQLFN